MERKGRGRGEEESGKEEREEKGRVDKEAQ